MATKKEQMTRDPNTEYPPRPQYQPPKVTVTLLEGDRLKAAVKNLSEQNTAADRATLALVEAEREKLAPTLEAARVGLERLNVWLKDNAADLTLLRGLGFDGARGVVDESLRVSAKNRVEGLLHVLQKTNEALVTADQRAKALKPADLEGARMSHTGAGIKAYEDLPYAATARIQLDVERAVRTVGQLDKILAETQDAVTSLATALDRAKRVRAKEATIPGAVNLGPVNPGATIIPPETLAERAAARPGRESLRAISEFSGYESDNR